MKKLIILIIGVFLVGSMMAQTVITDCEGLQNISNNFSEDYILKGDIDCSDTINWNGGAGFLPIKNFAGTLDGNGFTISDFYMNTTYLGMFYGLNKNPIIKNLNFVNAVGITNSGEGGLLFYGGITSSFQHALIDNVTIEGSVYGGTNEYAGGFGGFHSGEDDIIRNSHFVGYVEGAGGFVGQSDGIIINCSFSGTVDGRGTAEGVYYSGPDYENLGITGGFIGWNFGTIDSSFSEGEVIGKDCVGGFVGGNENWGDPKWPGRIDNSYSTAKVTGENYKGGFMGYNVAGDITNSYSTGEVIDANTLAGFGLNLFSFFNILPLTDETTGGFLAYIETYECYNSFWDTDTSGVETSACAVNGKTTEDMKTSETYTDAGWDDDIWLIQNGAYPCLKWQEDCEIVVLDQDNDGVLDVDDVCPGTTIGEAVNSEGCSCNQIEITFRECTSDRCEGEYWVDYPEDGYDTCLAGEITDIYSCESISSTYDLECDTDDDDDGVLDVDDVCPGTDITWTVLELSPNHYDSTNLYFTTTFGCGCEQILFCKPGENNGEYKFGCSQGTMNVWSSQTGWSLDCQQNGIVSIEGESKPLFENTDDSGLLDILDSDNDDDGIVDSQDDMDDDGDEEQSNGYGKPDWWEEKHPGK